MAGKRGGQNWRPQTWWVNSCGYVEGRIWEDGVQRRVKQHRYVMEVHLGRGLMPDEDVHHLNGDKLDNRTENLEILCHVEHAKISNAGRVRKRGYRQNISEDVRNARSAWMRALRRKSLALATGKEG